MSVSPKVRHPLQNGTHPTTQPIPGPQRLKAGMARLRSLPSGISGSPHGLAKEKAERDPCQVSQSSKIQSLKKEGAASVALQTKSPYKATGAPCVLLAKCGRSCDSKGCPIVCVCVCACVFSDPDPKSWVSVWLPFEPISHKALVAWWLFRKLTKGRHIARKLICPCPP